MTFPRRSNPIVRLAVAGVVATLLTALLPMAALQAQQEERPVTFDSAQRMTAITPMLADRMKLQAPAWPVAGTFREARLYAASEGGVLVVQREDGTLVRFPLDAGALQSLRAAVESGMRLAGNPSGEPDAYRYTEMAGSRLVRRQLILGPLLYGPLMASLASNGNDGSTLYLLGSGLPALVTIGLAGNGAVTRAQADLAMDGAPRFALLSSLAWRAGGGERSGDGHTIAVLTGAIGATAGGLLAGKRLTDGEGRGMIWGSNYALALTAGTMAATGAFHRSCTYATSDPYTYDRQCTGGTSAGEFAGLVGAGLVGYPLGLQYVRRASYSVTAGDLRAQSVGAGVGALLGAAAAGNDPDARKAWATTTGGLFLGMLAGDRLLVKPFDYTRGQGSVLLTGAIAGGVLGMALPAGSQSDNSSFVFGSAGVGAALGATLAHHIVHPRRGSQRGALRDAMLPRPADERLAAGASRVPGASGVLETSGLASARVPRVQWQLDPAAVAMAAAGMPGRHGILSLTF